MPDAKDDGPDYKLLKSDPERFLAIVQDYVRQYPTDPNGYFRRHHAWERLGRRDLALKDLDHSLRLEPHWVTFLSRGCLLRELGRYDDAIADFNRAEAADPESWPMALGPLYRADCHARQGNEAAALADCARLPDDHWTPGVFGTPAGDKQEVTAKIREIARSSKRN
jgi:tetratricopeptide (TPR) repeat protein